MLIKILLKILPALMPILIYWFWQILLKRMVSKICRRKYFANQNNRQGATCQDKSMNNEEKIIDGQFEDVKNPPNNSESKGHNNFSASQNSQIFSLHNKNFVIILYASLIIAIICIISCAL